MGVQVTKDVLGTCFPVHTAMLLWQWYIKSMKTRSGDCGLCVKCVKFMGVVHGVGGASEEGRYQTNLSTASNASNMLERDSFRLELFKQNIKCLK